MIDLSLGHVRRPWPREPRAVVPVAEYGSRAGDVDLREALAARHGVAATSVVITTGSSMAITAALASHRPPSVLLPTPYFPAFPRIVSLLGLDGRCYEARDGEGAANAADAARLVRRHPGGTIVWNYPHNPTGAIDDPERRAEVLAAVHEAGGEMIQDLVYSDLTYSPWVPPSGAPVDGEVRVYSLSKSHGLAGERIGYVIATEARAQEVERAHWALAMSPPATSQALAVAALDDASGPSRLLQELHQLRDEACGRLRQDGGVVVHPPDGGIFLWIEVPGLGIGGDSLAALCHQAGLLVVPGSAFGVGESAVVRLSFAVDREALMTGIDLFLALLDRIRARAARLT